MSCVLGIETSRDLCSAALYGKGETREHTRKMARAHNEHILELVDGVMAEAGLSPADLDGVAFGCGPGSFTGIRIAASVAQAIAFGAAARVLPISSTLALATAALETGRPVGEGLIASIRSRRDAHYLAGFAVAAGKLGRRYPDRLVTEDPGWPEIRQGWTIVGDRPTWLAPTGTAYADVRVGAGLIARLGAEAFAAGQSVPPELGLPVYVPGDSPWKPSSAPHPGSEASGPSVEASSRTSGVPAAE